MRRHCQPKLHSVRKETGHVAGGLTVSVVSATSTRELWASVTESETLQTSGAVMPAVLMPELVLGPMGSTTVDVVTVLDHVRPPGHVTRQA